MAIADTISSMYENVGEVYDTITNVDVNNGTNLLDYSTCKIGDLNTGTGAEETSTVRIISDFIEVTPNENYICTLIGGDYTTYYYSSNKAFISGGSSWIGSGNSFTTPNNTGYLRLKFKNANNTTISLNDLSNVMLNKGTTALPYQPYTDNPTYKNIENIPSTIRKSYLNIMNNGYQDIYDNWEKVNGTGTSISLNNTEEAPMTIEYKGNTSMLPKGYTQVEYIESTGTQYIDTGVNTDSKMSIDMDYQFTLQGTASYENCFGVINGSGAYLRYHFETRTANSLSFSYYHNNVINTYEGFYTDRVRIFVDMNNLRMQTWKNGTSQLDTNLQDFGDWDSELNFWLFRRNSNTTNLQYFSKNRVYYCKMYASGVLVRFFIPCYRNKDNAIGLYDIVNNQFYANQGTGTFVKGNDVTSSTSGLSIPTPTYPQDIHIVSGDNYINVVGKNLFDKSTESKNYLINSAGTLTPNNDYNSSVFIPIQPLTNVVLSTDQTSAILEIVEYDTNQSLINRGVKTNSTFYNLRTSNTTAYIRISYQNTSTKVQFEKDTTTATTYEEYKGASYEINLGKNLIPFSDIISTGGTTSNGITFTLQADGTIKANGTATAGISIYLTTNYIEQKAGTYTFSDGIASGQSGTTFFLYADVRHLDETSWDTKNFSTAETTTRTRTIEEAFKFKPRIVIRQGQILNNLIFKPMLEEGTSATSYSPYFTPIYLADIPPYRDRIFKSSGKNLFNANEVQIGMAWNNTSNSARAVIIIPVEQNITYTISMSGSNSMEGIYVSYSAKTLAENATNGVGLSLITSFPRTYTSSTEYIILQFNKSSISLSDIEKLKLQVEKGTTATTYEPYGKDWYLNKQIGKVVLNGSEDWNADAGTQGTDYRHNILRSRLDIPNPIGINGTYMSNYFRQHTMNNDSGFFGEFYCNSNWFIFLDKEKQYLIEGWKDWLSTHNTIVYYVLATPTYEKITGELLNQLEAIKNSYENQTNINQENNDLPFELEVGALEKY